MVAGVEMESFESFEYLVILENCTFVVFMELVLELK